jgi:ATP-binding cassette subfamily F protein 3
VLAGVCQPSRTLRIGYFAQHGVESLRDEDSALGFFQRLDPQARESALRDELGRYGFSGDDALRPIGPMSGGEKARLVLASIVRTRPHLLVLDEPTNHLDAATRDALTEALAEFDGALLLVSHDRYLLRATVDSFVLVHDGQVNEFEGDLDDYLQWLQRAAPAAGTRQLSEPDSGAGPRIDRREERRVAAQRRQQLSDRLRPIDKELSAVETRLAAVEASLSELEAMLSDPAVYSSGARVVELNRDRSARARDKEELETRWLELGELRERAERDFLAQQ